MYLIAIAWGYVALMMALAEATSSQGSILGAIVTLFLYGILPISIVMYILGGSHRKAARQRQAALEAAEYSAHLKEQAACQGDSENADASRSSQADGGHHAAADRISPVGKET
jgi:choline-glycine betaine transporter